MITVPKYEMAGGIDAKSALPLVVATAATAAVATYLIAKRQFESKIARERQESYASDRRERSQLDKERKIKSLPSGTKLR